MKEKNILKSPLYKIIRYGYYFLTTNLLFLVCNLLFFIIFFSVPLLIENIVWYTVALIPAGPAWVALFFCMGLVVRQQELAPVKDFFRSYRENLFLSLKFWSIQLVLLVILLVDTLYFFSQDNVFLGIFFGLVTVLVLLICIIGLSMIATFTITLANVYRSSVVILWGFWKSQLLNMITLFSFGFLLYAFPSEMFLFIFALLSFYFMRNQQPVFEKMAERFSNQKGESAIENKK
ncbi:DUF624 domain-containing protein [Jeotgalibaca caeni]|uniref:DUF624 domain-containing protein n=1 Tax=Jeotgalibaca caeni TaxID=3028623 RepID=UPI00237D9CB5|nr:DUF624 domain-containing protein [Jeotgalibaca caeni]MDE1549097.1 DUF624 domain-containing protein [Jeotgalibaca caeni]